MLRDADSDEALLADRRNIFVDEELGVLEDCLGFFERDAMLADVCLALCFVPLIDHAQRPKDNLCIYIN
ncbi:MAG TPA: hypothetical protein V6C97_26485 [Oculatellaceae cyanobacterium]